MAFLDDLGRKVSEVGQKTAQKTSELSANARLNSAIADSERIITTLYTQLGQSYYEHHKNDYEDAFSDLINKISNENKIIEGYKAQKEMIGATKTCVQCGSQLPMNAAFCFLCSAKQPERPAEPAESNKSTVLCGNCGASMPKGTAFCMSCGNPITANQKMPKAIPYPGKNNAKTCQFCGAEVPKDNRFCTSCGKEVLIRQDKPDLEVNNASETEINKENEGSSIIESESSSVLRCSNCGADNPSDRAFCISCGSRLRNDNVMDENRADGFEVREEKYPSEESGNEMPVSDALSDKEEEIHTEESGGEMPVSDDLSNKVEEIHTDEDASIDSDSEQQEADVEIGSHGDLNESENNDNSDSIILDAIETETCPVCGGLTPKGKQFCVLCGSKIGKENPTEKDTGNDSAQNESEEMIICTSCGATVPKGNRFCISCGVDLSGIVEEHRQTEKKLNDQDGKDDGELTDSLKMNSDLVVCPSCKTEVPSLNGFCIICGHELSLEDNPNQIESPNTETMKTVRCVSCGAEIPAGNHFCTFCGFDLSGTPEPIPLDEVDKTIHLNSPAGGRSISESYNSEKEEKDEIISEKYVPAGFIECQNCGQLVKENNKFCVRCGSKVMAIHRENEGIHSGMKYCVRCGSPITAGNSFCTMCGMKN